MQGYTYLVHLERFLQRRCCVLVIFRACGALHSKGTPARTDPEKPDVPPPLLGSCPYQHFYSDFRTQMSSQEKICAYGALLQDGATPSSDPGNVDMPPPPGGSCTPKMVTA